MVRQSISTNERTQIGNPPITNVLHDLRNALMMYLNDKSCGSFASTDEVLGLLTRQLARLQQSIGSQDAEEFRKELLELVTLATFALACWDSGSLNW